MRIFVLGATGFIGGQIARAAYLEGWDIHALRRRITTGAIGDLPVTWHQGDLSDSLALAAAMQDCTAVFHAAGYAPQGERHIPRTLKLGVTEMRHVLDAAHRAKVKKVIYTSSLTTIGTPPDNTDRLANENDGYIPGSTQNNYYEVKWAMEHEVLRATQHGLPVVILCPTAVFGPGDVKPSTSQLLLMLAQGKLPVAVDAWSNIVDGRDVGLAHVRAVESGQGGERYIIGGHNMNVADALEQAARVIGVKPPQLVLSKETITRLLKAADFLRLPIPATMRGIPYWQPLDAQKGQETFHFSPRPFEETVRDTITWFRENGYLS